jgi:hypothetical protein
MKKTSMLLLFFILLFTSGNICAETIALHADNDTYIDQLYPDINFGPEWKILISGSITKPAHGLLRFSLSGLPAGARITKARLTVLVHNNNSTGLFHVHPMTSIWGEDYATWNLAAEGVNWATPGGDFDPAIFVEAGLPGSAPDWIVIDVTSLISGEQGDLNAGAAANGLLLKTDAGYSKVLTADFASYENALTCHSCHGINDPSRDAGKSTNCTQCHSQGDISLSGEPTLIVDYEQKLCPAEIVFKNDTATLDLLRRFRDGVLSKTPEGRRWTAFYCRQADVIAEMLENSPELRLQTRAAVDRLLPDIGLLVDGKAVDHRAMRRDARVLIDLFKQKSTVELKTSLHHMHE